MKNTLEKEHRVVFEKGINKILCKFVKLDQTNKWES